MTLEQPIDEWVLPWRDEFTCCNACRRPILGEATEEVITKDNGITAIYHRRCYRRHIISD